MIGGDLNSDSSQPDYSLLNERNSEALPNRMVLVTGLEIRGCRALAAPSNWLGAPSKISRESPIQGDRSGDECSGKLYEASGAGRNTA